MTRLRWVLSGYCEKDAFTFQTTYPIVGFDNVAWAAFVEPALSTVEQPLEQMGYEAVELLLRRIDAPEAPQEHRVLPVELVHRSSVKNLSLQPTSARRGSVWA